MKSLLSALTLLFAINAYSAYSNNTDIYGELSFQLTNNNTSAAWRFIMNELPSKSNNVNLTNVRCQSNQGPGRGYSSVGCTSDQGNLSSETGDLLTALMHDRCSFDGDLVSKYAFFTKIKCESGEKCVITCLHYR